MTARRAFEIKVISRPAMHRPILFAEWPSAHAPSQALVQIRVVPPNDAVKEALRKHLGMAVDVALVSHDRRQVLAYVYDLTEELLDASCAAETELSQVLGQATELRLVAHQGRPTVCNRPGMDQVI
jgi:hypothetical protein